MSLYETGTKYTLTQVQVTALTGQLRAQGKVLADWLDHMVYDGEDTLYADDTIKPAIDTALAALGISH